MKPFPLCPPACLVAFALSAAAVAHERPFQIRVVDEATRRGVPLVELRTVHGLRLYTDSAGIAAFDEPGLMGQRVFFFVESHGYEFPPDAFGFRGKALDVEPGGKATLAVRRRNLAERLYRVTGSGIYRDSVLTGEAVPLRRPLLNAQVLGSDSVMNAVYRGKIYWFWGDTNRPAHVLGNYHVPGAVSILPEQGGLDPAAGVNLRYFVDESSFARPTAKMPGEGPTWIGGLTVLQDGNRRERMFAGYVKIKPPLTVYRRGLAEWNDAEERFEHVVAFPDNAPLHPSGHTFQREEDGVRYVYFCTPYPLVRVKATPEALRDPSRYEAFTCLVEGSRLDDPKLDRNSWGALRYDWKRNTPAVGPSEQATLVEQKRIDKHEGLLQLRDRDTGKPVLAHSGSVYWNAHRRRWVMIAVELFGESSVLGEVWLAEADSPEGPWTYAVKIVTHDKYSFYNPKQHPMFDQDGGRIVYFEGTYTHTFSGNPRPTPRYDYNQVMYRLDLADPRTALPVAVYSNADDAPDELQTGLPHGMEFVGSQIAFFALDHPGEDTVPVYAAATPPGISRLSVGPPEDRPDAAPIFYALAPDSSDRPGAVVPLYEHVHQDNGRRAYKTDPAWRREGFTPRRSPLCYVWPNPRR